MEERIKYLSQASQILPNTGELQKVACHLLYLQKKFLPDKNGTKDNHFSLSACPHCFMNFRGMQYSLKVIPCRKASRNLQKALVKEATSQPITGLQRSLLTKYRETHGKKLVIKCAICQKETEITLKKQKRDRTKRRLVTVESSADSSKNKSGHSKKKKKKDQFAGLKAAAVMSLKSKRNKKKDQFAGLKATAVVALSKKKKPC